MNKTDDLTVEEVEVIDTLLQQDEAYMKNESNRGKLGNRTQTMLWEHFQEQAPSIIQKYANQYIFGEYIEGRKGILFSTLKTG